MIEKFEKIIANTCKIPPMPHVSAKIVEMLSRESITATQLADTIARDTALATRVLNMANSAFYRRLQEIRELRSAIVILGLRTIRNLVLGASLKQIFKTSSLFDSMLWQHSIAASIAAATLAKETGYPRSDEALVAGLLHDVGKNILNNSMPDRYQQVVERVYLENLTYCEVESEVFGFAHHHVGPILVKLWSFPLDLGKAIYYHHEIQEVDGTMEATQKQLVALVHLADLFCRKLGLGYRAPDETVEILDSPALPILGLNLDEENIQGYEEKIIQTFTEEKGRFE